MIIHKPESERPPHAGIEYYHKSVEPETIAECLDLFCWKCIHEGFHQFFQQCAHYQKLKGLGHKVCSPEEERTVEL